MSKRRLFALSDLHLSFASPKPMDVFGAHWSDHVNAIERNWRMTVGAADIVLVPGDVSWAMRLDGALPDLTWLSGLPGEKVLVRGNHDYWWQSVGKLEALRLPGLHFVHNNHVVIGPLAVGGSRLWDFPGILWPFDPLASGGETGGAPAKPRPAPREGDPEKIRAREIERLKSSLSGLPADARLKVALTHYPPLGENGLPTPLTDLIGSFAVDLCVFGHVHTPAPKSRPGEDIIVGPTRYVLASTDRLAHKPLFLAEFE
ncbi:MAG: metallophosphoesterase [Planctomycetota bacterium]|jgi:predicted phosphohydrolase|nr:metallophosphoesterase [Planctomycetota bacterium]